MDRLQIFSCKFCGYEDKNPNAVKNCENNHLHTGDLVVGRIERPANSKFCYRPQSPFPSFIYVKRTDKALDGAVYQLVEVAGRPVGRRIEAPRPAPTVPKERSHGDPQG